MTSHLAPNLQQTVITGGAAGDHTVTGIKVTDKLVAVLDISGPEDLTSEFTITADDTINNTGGTATTSDTLLVTYFRAHAQGGGLNRS
jgi:hypothetical protein